MWIGVVCQQLKKEGRRNAYELHKIQALHQRQKMVSHQDVESSMCCSVILGGILFDQIWLEVGLKVLMSSDEHESDLTTLCRYCNERQRKLQLQCAD